MLCDDTILTLNQILNLKNLALLSIFRGTPAMVNEVFNFNASLFVKITPTDFAREI